MLPPQQHANQIQLARIRKLLAEHALSGTLNKFSTKLRMRSFDLESMRDNLGSNASTPAKVLYSFCEGLLTWG